MESSSWLENHQQHQNHRLLRDRKKVIDELVKGQNFAKKLSVMLNESVEGDGGGSNCIPVADAVKEISNSFTTSLAILNEGGHRYGFDEVSQIRAASNTQVGSPCGDHHGQKSEDSGDSSKSTSRVKDRRGCYKRRKTSHSWTSDAPTLLDDGYQWRKYGQKVILRANYPRNYFRCTHKYDQNCQATKQVQRIQEEPPLYRTTYSGHHTCKKLPNASQLALDQIIDDRDHTDSSIILSFNSANNNDHHRLANKHDNPFLTSFQSVKQEYNNNKDEIDMPSDLTTQNYDNNQSSSSDYLLSPERDHMSTLNTSLADVISGMNSSSCTTSTRGSLDMSGILVGSIDFADVLEFEF